MGQFILTAGLQFSVCAWSRGFPETPALCTGWGSVAACPPEFYLPFALSVLGDYLDCRFVLPPFFIFYLFLFYV